MLPTYGLVCDYSESVVIGDTATIFEGDYPVSLTVTYDGINIYLSATNSTSQTITYTYYNVDHVPYVACITGFGIASDVFFNPLTGNIFDNPVSITNSTSSALTVSGDIVTEGLTVNTSATIADLVVSAATISTGTTSGALVVTGGVGIGGNLNIGGYINLLPATLTYANSALNLQTITNELNTIVTWTGTTSTISSMNSTNLGITSGTTAGTFVCNLSSGGFYNITGYVSWDSGNTSGQRMLYLSYNNYTTNGSNDNKLAQIQIPASTGGTSLPFSTTLKLNNTDGFCIFVWQNSGSSASINSQTSKLTISRLW
jgi:hypothetical protein